jgi:hypothetical protein
MKIMVYCNRWDGWDIWKGSERYHIGELPAKNSLREYCEKHAVAYGFSIGLEGWEL